MTETHDKLIEKPNSGLASSFKRRTKRVINKDGTFNVLRKGRKNRVIDVYQHLINCSWFLCVVYITVFYFTFNFLFAMIYSSLGDQVLSSFEGKTFGERIPDAFYFSVQTFTSVGYGGILPTNGLGNFISAIESMIGLICFAIATGVLYGRFSKPVAKMEFSDWALITPFKNGLQSLQFKIVNRRNSQMMNLEATVLYTHILEENGLSKREYKVLDLELNRILFFPLSWTIVHPIDENSPIHGKGYKEFEEEYGEFLIYIKGFDEVYGTEVNLRYSYLYDELKMNHEFVRNFETNEEGIIEIDLDKLSEVKAH